MAGAQDTADYFGKIPFAYADMEYQENIRTVMLHPANDPTGFPLLNLNDPDARLQLSFDGLNAGDQDYYFTVVHCTKDWKPSPLLSSEYIDGFFDEQIFNVRQSRNTIRNYTHYEQIIPSASMRITKTGNYIVKVFPEGDPDHPVLSRRFLVIAERLWCFASVTQSQEVNSRWEKQELNFEVDHSSIQVFNPATELTFVILKNRNWEKPVWDPEPFSVFDKKLSFQLNEKLRFPGGKEFRYFNSNSIHTKSEWVDEVTTDKTGSTVRLFPCKPLNKTKYLEYEELNGGYMPDLAYSKQSELEADYVFVDFKLEMPALKEKGNIYIYGALSNWKCSPSFRMRFNEDKGYYECRLLLKQGYYNYRFAFLPDGQDQADEEKIDGSSYETENEYIILIYHSPPGSNYDRLIGFRSIRSFY